MGFDGRLLLISPHAVKAMGEIIVACRVKPHAPRSGRHFIAQGARFAAFSCPALFPGPDVSYPNSLAERFAPFQTESGLVLGMTPKNQRLRTSPIRNNRITAPKVA